MQKEHLLPNRREYIRVDSVFPVQFRLLSNDTKSPLCAWQQGFTNDIGKGGICVRINNADQAVIKRMKHEQPRVVFEIELPFRKFPIHAEASVTWVKEVIEDSYKCFIGLRYEHIDPALKSQLLRYVWGKKLFVPLMMAAISIVSVAFIVNSFINVRLLQGNKALVSQLVNILQERSMATKKINDISQEKQGLELKIQTLQSRIQTVELDKKSLEEGQVKSAKRIDELNEQIVKLKQEKAPLEAELIVLQDKEGAVTEELLRLNQKKAYLEKANFDKMYQWLVVHQNPRTGLLISFEGDSNVAGWAFLYDQSLAAQAFTYFSDFERARKILDFYVKKAKKREGLFLNAYYATDGSPAEYIIHSGPNVWLGIAIAQYTHKTKDTRYLPLAEEIARLITGTQCQDEEGGIKGGPNLVWYSTEHNLDAYAFLNMLHEITGKRHYAESRDKILNWLAKHAYDAPDVPILRGKGDATIATDTYAWSIAAVGPKKLEEMGMNVEKIMEFAEERCAVEVNYTRPEGTTVKVKGFDFAVPAHVARGGVVSSEWTAQMVLAFKIMADFYRGKDIEHKARNFEQKADEYLASLSTMIVSSPSPTGQGEGCLPYASEDSVDTGHGWITPKGKSTGSVAGTVYTLFAYYKYNPLELK